MMPSKQVIDSRTLIRLLTPRRPRSLETSHQPRLSVTALSAARYVPTRPKPTRLTTSAPTLPSSLPTRSKRVTRLRLRLTSKLVFNLESKQSINASKSTTPKLSLPRFDRHVTTREIPRVQSRASLFVTFLVMSFRLGRKAAQPTAQPLSATHPLSLELSSLRTALLHYQTAAHQSSIQLQGRSLELSLLKDQDKALRDENEVLKREVEVLRYVSDDLSTCTRINVRAQGIMNHHLLIPPLRNSRSSRSLIDA